MAAVDESIEQSLKEICGDDRVRTDRRERKMYSFDIGAMPKLVKPFVPAGVAGAVVRPRDEAQIVRAREARAESRHAARAARVGDDRLRRRAAPDRRGRRRHERPPACSRDRCGQPHGPRQAGAIWENVDREIGMQGLALRMYPSSYPSSSVGRLARPGRIGVRQLRVRHLQGERHRRPRRVADRRGQGVHR